MGGGGGGELQGRYESIMWGGGGVIDRHQSKYIKTFNLEKLRVHLIFISVEKM